VTFSTPIIVVSYGNPDEIVECVGALARMRADPAFDVYICENGGLAAFDALLGAIDGSGFAATAGHGPDCDTSGFAAVRAFGLAGHAARIFVGCAKENLGYGGGINVWLRPLLAAGDWPGVFVLNPDATPHPDALFHLAKYARERGRGMVTGRILRWDGTDRIQTRGLRWNPWRASNISVDRGAPADERPDIDRVEREIDAVSGAMVYATRACVDRVGPLTEFYFLYYEDLDWGMRAKAACGLGYAFDAVVRHKGGTTIGGGGRRSASSLSLYLEFRNRLLFVRANKPRWYPWTVAVSALRAFEYLAVGNARGTRAALSGVVAGLMGETGRPDRLFKERRP
jgi:GT2 family glycosyltransferase